MTKSDEFEVQVLNEFDNGSTTDTLQWCELHRGHCNDVVPVRRVFDVAPRSHEGSRPHKSQIFFACQGCIRDLKKAELIVESKYAGLPCLEVVVPRGLSKGREVALSYARTKSRRSSDPSLLRSPRQQRRGSAVKSFEITLDALQVKYLRALGLRVIPT